MTERDDGDRAALDRIRAVCLALPHVEEAELQGRPLFRVGQRHHRDRGWLSTPIDAASDWGEITELLDAAYRQAAPKYLSAG
jgi:hypothetical protein